MKLIDCFQSSNEKIRILSFAFFTELIWNNEMIQNVFCEKYNFNPIGNIICINFIPELFQQKIPLTEVIINLIKQSQFTSKKQSSKYWKWPENSKYSDNVIPDPQRYLLGFYYSGNHTGINDMIIENNSSDIEQQIINLLEEGYEAESLDHLGVKKKDVINDKNDPNNQQKPLMRNMKDEYQKKKNKNVSKSIDSTISIGDKYINKHFK